MSDGHIIDMLDEGLKADNLSLQEINKHCALCENCRQAYMAWRVSQSLIKARSAEIIEPSPFFQTRLKAALKEREAEPMLFWRMWKAAGMMVTSMMAVVAILLVLSIYINKTSNRVNNPDPPDVAVILGDDPQPADMTYNQVLTALFDSEDSHGSNNEK